MKKRKAYVKQACQVRKLRALRRQADTFAKAAMQAWDNEDWEQAKQACLQAQEAEAAWLAYFNTLRGWQESGVPCE